MYTHLWLGYEEDQEPTDLLSILFTGTTPICECTNNIIVFRDENGFSFSFAGRIKLQHRYKSTFYLWKEEGRNKKNQSADFYIINDINIVLFYLSFKGKGQSVEQLL